MHVSDERLEEFKRIFKKNHNHEFKDNNEAREAVENLVGFMELLWEVHIEGERRREKLIEHPDGFPIDNDGVYTCFVCCTSITTENGWYDKYGLKCLNCQRATNLGILPPCVFEDRKSWFSLRKLQTELSFHSSKIKELIRSNKLKARIVFNNNNQPYYYVFLYHENIEFIRELQPDFEKN